MNASRSAILLVDDPPDEGAHRLRRFGFAGEQLVQFHLLTEQGQEGSHRERGLAQHVDDRRGIVARALRNDRFGRQPKGDGDRRVGVHDALLHLGEVRRHVGRRRGDDNDGAGRHHLAPGREVGHADIVGIEQGQVQKPGHPARAAPTSPACSVS